jgi:hypothetical protein
LKVYFFYFQESLVIVSEISWLECIIVVVHVLHQEKRVSMLGSQLKKEVFREEGQHLRFNHEMYSLVEPLALCMKKDGMEGTDLRRERERERERGNGHPRLDDGRTSTKSHERNDGRSGGTMGRGTRVCDVWGCCHHRHGGEHSSHQQHHKDYKSKNQKNRKRDPDFAGPRVCNVD